MGLNGTNLYVEGYRQVRGPTAHGPGRTAIGVGGRAGVPGFHWSEHRDFARVDLKMAPGVTLLMNPGLLLNTGNSPNGENPGSFWAITQGFGLELRWDGTSWTPFMTWVGGWTRRTHWGETRPVTGTSFVVSGMSVTF
jgi:hypothetical protein